MTLIKVEVKEISIGANKPSIDLSRRLTHAMFNSVMQNFESEGPGWSPLKAKTIKQRLRANFGAGPILNRRKRIGVGLWGTIIEAPTKTQAVVGSAAGIPYAAIHQFGGVIKRTVKPGSVNLRLSRGKSGKLLRQENYKNLAVFGTSKHKTKKVEYKGGKSYQITIVARPFLKFTENLIAEITSIAKNFFEGK